MQVENTTSADTSLQWIRKNVLEPYSKKLGRPLTEPEIRVQQALERLSIPEWYRQYWKPCSILNHNAESTEVFAPSWANVKAKRFKKRTPKKRFFKKIQIELKRSWSQKSSLDETHRPPAEETSSQVEKIHKTFARLFLQNHEAVEQKSGLLQKEGQFGKSLALSSQRDETKDGTKDGTKEFSWSNYRLANDQSSSGACENSAHGQQATAAGSTPPWPREPRQTDGTTTLATRENHRQIHRTVKCIVLSGGGGKCKERQTRQGLDREHEMLLQKVQDAKPKCRRPRGCCNTVPRLKPSRKLENINIVLQRSLPIERATEAPGDESPQPQPQPQPQTQPQPQPQTQPRTARPLQLPAARKKCASLLLADVSASGTKTCLQMFANVSDVSLPSDEQREGCDCSEEEREPPGSSIAGSTSSLNRRFLRARNKSKTLEKIVKKSRLERPGELGRPRSIVRAMVQELERSAASGPGPRERQRDGVSYLFGPGQPPASRGLVRSTVDAFEEARGSASLASESELSSCAPEPEEEEDEEEEEEQEQERDETFWISVKLPYPEAPRPRNGSAFRCQLARTSSQLSVSSKASYSYSSGRSSRSSFAYASGRCSPGLSPIRGCGPSSDSDCSGEGLESLGSEGPFRLFELADSGYSERDSRARPRPGPGPHSEPRPGSAASSCSSSSSSCSLPEGPAAFAKSRVAGRARGSPLYYFPNDA